MQTFVDSIPGWLVFALLLLALGIAATIGRLTSRATPRGPDEPQTMTHAGWALGALLALLGLLLSFSFTIVESRFLMRKQLVVDEANAIGTTYLRAGMLPAPHDARVAELVRRYVDVRVGVTPEHLESSLRQSERLHGVLWREAEAVAERHPTSEIAGLFVASLNQLIDLHESRVAAALYSRLPLAFLGTLLAVALLSMASLGYTAARLRTRALIPTAALMTSVALVMFLIVELDRPWQRVFPVSQSALLDVQRSIEPEGVPVAAR